MFTQSGIKKEIQYLRLSDGKHNTGLHLKSLGIHGRRRRLVARAFFLSFQLYESVERKTLN